VRASTRWTVIWLPLPTGILASLQARQHRSPQDRDRLEAVYRTIRDRWRDELYDMRTERWQRRDLAQDGADRGACRRLIEGCSGRQAAPNPTQPDEELAEQLRSLGHAE
jgi:hypothetical protein